MLQMISNFAAERTAHFFPGLRDRLRVVPNAASDSFFRPPTAAGLQVLDTLGIRGRQFVLVPGGLQFRKNADLILDAWPQISLNHPDLLLVVINHADATYLDRAKALGASCILGGFQEEEQLVALYQAAQVVWFPTLYDGFGMPVIEAMASGTPVVSSNTTGIPEVAGDAAVLLSPQDVSSHIEVITGLIDDTPHRRDLISRGRTRAAGYTWQASSDKLLREFKNLL